MATEPEAARSATGANGTAVMDAPATESELDDDREVIECNNPATGESLGAVPVTKPEELEQAVTRANDAQRRWRRLPVDERAEYLTEAREIMLDHRTELRDLVVAETGKARMDSIGELLTVFDTFTYYANEGPQILADETPSLHLFKNKRVTIHHEPKGLVANISPWNFPLDLAVTPIVPALLAGNSVIIKPSEQTPLTAMRAAELINQTGLPDGLLQVAPGYGEIGAQLVDHADAVSFTGSVPTGRKVAEGAGRNLISSTLELGGKDPAIVLEDADIERSGNGIVWGGFYNGGQCCMSIERVYAHKEIYEELVDRIVSETRQLRQGVPNSDDIDVGAVIMPEQVETIEEHVADAVDKGATVLCGGQRADINEGGLFYEPTVLVDVDHSMKIMTEETFGPVLPIMRVPTGAEAVRLANDSRFGLNSSIWSRDKKRARRLARQINAGNVCINDFLTSYAVLEAPYGGVGESGLGRRKGRWELEEYTNPKTVAEDLIGLSRDPYWYPYSEKVHDAFDRAFDALFRRGWTGKIKGLFGAFRD